MPAQLQGANVRRKSQLQNCTAHTHTHQVAELATQMYITNDKPNVSGLVLSGSADFKTELSQSDMFDPRLQAVVLGVVDVSYGERGVCDNTCVACV
jgi:peptide chain release factor subunit 1